MSASPDSWTAIRGAWVNKQGTIVCQQSDATAQIVMGSAGWTDQQIKATILFSSGAAGVIGRFMSSPVGYYALTCYPQSSINQLRLDLVSSNLNRNPLFVYSSLPGISVSQDYVVELNIQGSNIRGYVNNIKYVDITDSTLSAGGIGVDWQAGQGLFRDVHVNILLPDGNLAPVTFPTDFGMYCSPDDVLSLLTGIPTTDIATLDDIGNYIKQASDMINRETYSAFGRGIRVEERYDGTGQFTLVLNHSPIVKLYSLQIADPNNVTVRTFTSADAENPNTLIVEPNLGLLTIPGTQLNPQFLGTSVYPWPAVNPFAGTEAQGIQYDYFNRFGYGNRNILVSYAYGYSVVPEVIRWATAKIVAALLLIKRGNKDSGGAVQLTMEGLTVSFLHRQGRSQPFGGTIEGWEQNIQEAINQYKRIPPAIM